MSEPARNSDDRHQEEQQPDQRQAVKRRARAGGDRAVRTTAEALKKRRDASENRPGIRNIIHRCSSVDLACWRSCASRHSALN